MISRQSAPAWRNYAASARGRRLPRATCSGINSCTVPEPCAGHPQKSAWGRGESDNPVQAAMGERRRQSVVGAERRGRPPSKAREAHRAAPPASSADAAIDISGRILNFVDLHNGAVTAVATIFIATFTIVLAVVTRRQARLTRIVAKAAQRSASVAERALVELERPFAFVEVIDAGIGINPTSGFLIGFAGQQFRFQVIN
jgi:hypothetical protein